MFREVGKARKEAWENIKHPSTVFAKAEKKTSISSLKEALSHYRSKAGGTVPASSTLIEEMKNDAHFKKDIFGPDGKITKIIKKKIEDALKSNVKEIRSQPGSYTGGLWCTTLGGYSISIDYVHKPIKGENNVNLHLYGKDKWDFAKVEGASKIHNFMHETLPGIIAGDGTDFYISYDFYYNLKINVA